jgi:hypothetical protein
MANPASIAVHHEPEFLPSCLAGARRRETETDIKALGCIRDRTQELEDAEGCRWLAGFLVR